MTQVKPDPDAWINIIDRMLEKEKYQFAKDFLTELKTKVQEEDVITTGQTTAIMNIRRSKLHYD